MAHRTPAGAGQVDRSDRSALLKHYVSFDVADAVLRAAAKTWRRLQGEKQLPKVIGGVRFQDGIEVIEVPSNHAA
jgi:hypothetical protein